MPFPFMTALTALPAIMSAGKGISSLFKRRSRRHGMQGGMQGLGPTDQSQMNMPQGMGYMQVPGGKGQQPGSFFQVPRYTPQQQQLQQQVGQLGLESLQNPSALFAPIREAEMARFQQDTIPNILEQLTASGPSGERSSAYGQSLIGGAQGLARDLASQEAQFGQQQQQLGLNMLQPALQDQYDRTYTPPMRQSSWWESVLPMLANVGGQFGSQYMQNRNMENMIRALKK